jgi:putative ABC transport system permease protein
MVTMALGVGASTAIFSLIRPTLLHPFTFSRAGELVIVDERDPQGRATPVSYPDFREWSSQRSVVPEMGAFDIGFFELTGIDDPEEIPGALVTTNLFHMLGVAPVLGRDFREGEERSVILTDAAWKKRFGGDPNILGRNVALDFARTKEIERYTVIGVMPPDFWMYYGNFEVFVPLEHGFIREDRKARGLIAIGRRAPGVSVEQAQAALSAVTLEPGWSVRVRSWEQAATQPVRPELLLLAAAAGLLLLIASANVAGLLLVRAQARRREMAIRVALGASQWRLTRLLLGESLRLALAAAILGGALAWWGVKAMMAVLPPDIEQTRLLPGLDRVAVDPAAMLFAGVTAVAACMFAGLAPVWRARGGYSQGDHTGSPAEAGILAAARTLAADLKDAGSPESQRGRKTLVTVEVALSVVLLAGAGLLIKTLERIRSIDLGFRPERLLILRVPSPRGDISPSYYPDLARRVASLPGVRSEALFSSLTGRSREGFEIPGRSERFTANEMVVQPGYFETFGIPLRRGRVFDERDQRQGIAGGAGVNQIGVNQIVVNQTLARRFWAQEDPIGRSIKLDREVLEVIGVVADTRPLVFSDPEPMVYRPLRDGRAGQMAVRTVGDPLALARAVTGVVRDLGGVVAEVGTMEHFVEDNTWQQEQSAGLLEWFAAIALILSTAGLYGVISFAVGRRTREIGIRIAIGAPRQHVIGLVLRETFQPVMVGLAIGLAAALALSRFISGLLYQVEPADPRVFASVALLIVCAALASCGLPLRRALRVDPVVALRYE